MTSAYSVSEVTTDSTGSIYGSVFPCAASVYSVDARPSGYAEYVANQLPLPADGAVTVTLHLATPTFSGVVVDADGNPLAGVVLTGTIGNAQSPNWTTTTRSDGSFGVAVPANVYMLDVMSSGFYNDGDGWSVTGTLDMTQGNVVGQTLTVPLVGVTVTASDTSANPVSGAVVSLDADCQGASTADLLPGVAISSVYSYFYPLPTATTDGSGSASFPDAVVACTTADIIAAVTPPAGSGLSDNAGSITGPISADQTIAVTLPTGSEFSGVLDDSTGAPAPGWTIELTNSANATFETETASDGSFSISVTPGSYDLTVENGENNVVTDNLDLSQSLTGVTLTLPPLQPLTLTLEDSSGTPLSGAEVEDWGVSCSSPSTTVYDVLPGIPATSIESTYSASEVTTDSSGSIYGSVFPCAASVYSVDARPSGVRRICRRTNCPCRLTGW